MHFIETFYERKSYAKELSVISIESSSYLFLIHITNACVPNPIGVEIISPISFHVSINIYILVQTIRHAETVLDPCAVESLLDVYAIFPRCISSIVLSSKVVEEIEFAIHSAFISCKFFSQIEAKSGKEGIHSFCVYLCAIGKCVIRRSQSSPKDLRLWFDIPIPFFFVLSSVFYAER